VLRLVVRRVVSIGMRASIGMRVGIGNGYHKMLGESGGGGQRELGSGEAGGLGAARVGSDFTSFT